MAKKRSAKKSDAKKKAEAKAHVRKIKKAHAQLKMQMQKLSSALASPSLTWHDQT
jgi:hypothetical protein